MKRTKYIFIGILLFLILSCTGSKKEIEGVWINKNVRTIIDTLNIKNIKDNSYLIELKSWKKGKKRVKRSTAVFVENVLKLSSNSIFIFTENKEFLIGDETFIKIK
ncbi:MAG: hypothetical protein ACPGTO_09415 [Polaribacter sp.]